MSKKNHFCSPKEPFGKHFLQQRFCGCSWNANNKPLFVYNIYAETMVTKYIYKDWSVAENLDQCVAAHQMLDAC